MGAPALAWRFRFPAGRALPTKTPCWSQALKLYSMNHEMATHTSTHSQLTPTYSKLAWDITSARDWMVGCGIPKEDVVGESA